MIWWLVLLAILSALNAGFLVWNLTQGEAIPAAFSAGAFALCFLASLIIVILETHL